MKIFKKIIILLPVVIVSLLYFRVLYYENYNGASFKRVAGFVLSIALLYGWVLFFTIRKRQESVLQVIVHSSFFVYVFAVLQLTGYFILFREVSAHGWWDKMNHRIEANDHVNLTAFNTINIYSTFDKQIAGNFVMLLPLGIYLPLLYRKFRRASGFFAVLIISFLVSVGIELLQLATSYRSADVDDVILNTCGACVGFFIYQVIKAVVRSGKK